MTIYHLFNRWRQFNEIMSNNAIHRGRYIRLMMLTSTDMFLTIPIASYFLSQNVERFGLEKYSWAVTHHNWSHIPQIPSIEWQNDRLQNVALELTRWSFVGNAFIFFAFFGFADEAQVQYRRVYTSISRRVGYSTSSGTLAGSSHAYVVHPTLSFRMFGSRLFSTMSNKAAGVMVSVMKSGNRRDSDLSFSDQLSIPSISIPSDPKHDFKIEQDSPSEPTASSSVSSFADESLGQLPQLPDTTNPTIQSTSPYPADAADTV
jgi:Pheromone A receptor